MLKWCIGTEISQTSLAWPEISEFLVELCDDDRLAGGGDDHLHVGLALPHLPGSLLTGAGRLEYHNYYISSASRLKIKSDIWNLISPFMAFLFLDFDGFDNKIFYRSRSFCNTCWTPLVLGREGKSCWISLELFSRLSLSSIPLSLNSLLLSWLT